MNRLIIAIILVLISTKSYATSYKESIKAALEKNNQLKSQFKDLETSKLQKTKSVLNFLPQVSASVNRNKIDQKTLGINSEGAYSSNSLTVNQNLFKGGSSFSAYKLSKLSLEAQEYTTKSTIQNVILASSQAYLNYLLMKESYKVAQLNEELLTKNYESINLRFDLGEATKTDVAQAKSRLSTAQSQRITYKGQLDAAKSEFVKYFGFEPLDDQEDPPMPNNLPDSIDDAIQSALKNNYDLKVAHLNLRQTRENIKVAVSKVLPSVDAQGSVSKVSDSSITDKKISRSAVLSVSVPIFQNGSEYVDIKSSTVQKEKYKNLYNKAMEDIISQVTSYYVNYDSLKSSIESAQEAVNSAQLAYEGIVEEAKIGLKTNLDELNADQDLFEAKIQLLKNKYQAINAAYQLLAAIGKLDLDFL